MTANTGIAGMPKTPLEAVTLGLYLALTAETEAKARKALKMTEEIIVQARMSEHEIDTAKALALAEMEITK